MKVPANGTLPHYNQLKRTQAALFIRRPSPLCLYFLAKRVRRFKNLFRPGADPVVLGEVHPADGAGGVQKKLGRPGNVLAVDSLTCMNKVVASNHFRFGIGKKSECVLGFLTKIARDFGKVHANSNRANPRLMELIQILLNAP